MSQVHRNRPHQKKNTAKKNKFASRSPKSTSPTRAPIKREANQNQKESLKTEGQKAILLYYETKTTPYSHKTILAIYKTNKTLTAKKFYFGCKLKKNYKTTKKLSTLNHSYHSPSSQDYLKSQGPKPNRQ